jgi:HEAT repeat protein
MCARPYPLLALFTAGILLCSLLSVRGEELHVLNPDPRIQDYVSRNATQILQLQSIVENRGADVKDRMTALSQLSLISEDVGVEVAAKLVNDPSQDMARAAVDVLSNATVMAGHGGGSSHQVGDHQPASPWAQYVNAEHDVVRTALRAATKDPRPEVAVTALKSLVRLSDDAAIRAVPEAVNKGQIAEEEAVSICAQSDSDLGRACVLDYLDHGSPDGKRAAVSVLGSIPSVRSMIRNKIFLNSNADPKLRSTAAEVLAVYDPSFTSYALTVTADPKVPPEVYASTLKNYALSAQLSGKLDSAQWAAIKEALDNKVKAVESDPLHSQGTIILRALRDKFSTGRPEL